jgi:hypothetical protein
MPKAAGASGKFSGRDGLNDLGCGDTHRRGVAHHGLK